MHAQLLIQTLHEL